MLIFVEGIDFFERAAGEQQKTFPRTEHLHKSINHPDGHSSQPEVPELFGQQIRETINPGGVLNRLVVVSVHSDFKTFENR